MKCPSCGAASAEGAAECPACGLIFAKWREREEKGKREALLAIESLEAPPKPAPDPWIARGAAGAVVLFWMAAFAFYLSRHASKGRQPLGVDTGETVEMRDPRTGEMRRMPIRRLGGVPTAPAPAPAGADQ